MNEEVVAHGGADASVVVESQGLVLETGSNKNLPRRLLPLTRLGYFGSNPFNWPFGFRKGMITALGATPSRFSFRHRPLRRGKAWAVEYFRDVSDLESTCSFLRLRGSITTVVLAFFTSSALQGVGRGEGYRFAQHTNDSVSKLGRGEGTAGGEERSSGFVPKDFCCSTLRLTALQTWNRVCMRK